jgi:hypothetical protein
MSLKAVHEPHQKLDNLRVFTTTSIKATNELKSTADKYVKSTGLEELMRVNDSGKHQNISKIRKFRFSNKRCCLLKAVVKPIKQF